MRLGLPPQEVDNFTMGGLQFHSDVVEGKRRIPCFTTPTSPSPHGRPPPQKHKSKMTEEVTIGSLHYGSMLTKYADHAMAWRGDEAIILPPELKEQLHTIRRATRKCWHMSVAVFILAITLQFTKGTAREVPAGVALPWHIMAMGEATWNGFSALRRHGGASGALRIYQTPRHVDTTIGT